jgi:hypothetical protein
LSKSLGIVGLVLSCVSIVIAFGALIGFILLNDEYNTYCTGLIGGIAQLSEENRQTCDSLWEAAGAMIFGAVVFGLGGLIGLIISGILLASSRPKPVMMNPHQFSVNPAYSAVQPQFFVNTQPHATLVQQPVNNANPQFLVVEHMQHQQPLQQSHQQFNEIPQYPPPRI